MKKKLTLRLDAELIKKAKSYAAQKGASVSQIVADYFQALQYQETEEPEVAYRLPPATASLSGILEGKSVNEAEYRAHLETKHSE